MKSMKKTLSIILAAVMLFAVCSMSVSAAVPDGNVIALGIKVKDGQVIEKGKPVTFVVTLEETADFYAANGGLNVGEFEIAYNSAIFEPVPESGYGDSSLKGHGVSLNKNDKDKYAVAGGVDTANSSVLEGSAGVDAANNWDSVMHITLVEDGSAAMDARYIDCSNGPVDTFEFQLKVKADAADGTYKVGHNKTGYDNYSAYVISGNDAAPSTGWYVFMEDVIGCSPIYDFGTCDVTVGQGGPTGPTEPTEPTAALANLDPRVQWKESGSNVICIGFEGQITGEAIVVDDVVNSKIAEIGFEFSTTDNSLNGATKVKVDKIYDFTGNTPNTYKFRAVVVKAMSAADATDPDEGGYTHNLYARAYVTIGDKTTYATDIIETTVYDEYSEGVASGLATLAANLG